jgi:hypothetical protein
VARQEADCRWLAEDRGMTVTQVYLDNARMTRARLAAAQRLGHHNHIAQERGCRKACRVGRIPASVMQRKTYSRKQREYALSDPGGSGRRWWISSSGGRAQD